MAGQGANMKEMTKKSKKKLKFYIDPGGPGGHPRGSRTDPRPEKRSNISIRRKNRNNQWKK